MSRIKTFIIYALWIILFFIFSELIINVGLNSSYKDMRSISKVEQVNIEQAQATLINGRIKGTIKNIGSENINGKYLKIDIYSERGVHLGAKYYDINNLGEEETQDFQLYFKTEYAKYYRVSIVDEKDTDDDLDKEIEFISKDLSKSEIVVATFLTILIFW